MKKIFLTIGYLILCSVATQATGLMMPVAKDYPKDFLRMKTNNVTVYFNGLTAETVVYQEFVNEWTQPTDAVYSFPLPANARATSIVYWHNDTAYKAILKVQEQSTNPGTGDGGVAALVNTYIGSNGIKFMLNQIKPGEIQRVELHYLNVCDFYKGRCSYTFPLNTSQFITYPIDMQQYTFKVKASTPITNWGLSSFPTPQVIESSAQYLNAVLPLSKQYLDQDINFFYETSVDKLGVDLYAAANDTSAGHFTLFVRPEDTAVKDSVFKKCELFLLSASSAMNGVKFAAAVRAVESAIDLLQPTDQFNIFIDSYNYSSWQPAPVLATADNITSAKSYLATLNTGGEANFQSYVLQALAQAADTSVNTSLLLFTDSGYNLDPKFIESENIRDCGIFPIGIGENVNRPRLEMTAALNYGFVTYISSDDNLYAKMVQVVNQINLPLLKNVAFEYAIDKISDVLPKKLQSVYAGSSFYLTGRFATKSTAPISIAGNSYKGFSSYDFLLNFGDTANYKQFTESLWAKAMIDAIEEQIIVYGETPELKQQDISISLGYGIRCKYTAYIADYKTLAPTTAVKDKKALDIPRSYLTGNYPNPFNPSTKIRFYIDAGSLSKVKFIKVYNMAGQLIAVFDITNMNEGWHEITFNGHDQFGNMLASGVYIVRMQIGEQFTSSVKIVLMK